VENGSKEIILLGQNVNAYNFKDKKLSHLLYALSDIKNLERIRYTTSHPKDFTDDLIEAHGSCKKLMPLLHLPVQSGSTRILESMNRNHTVDEYIEIINKLKKKRSSIKFSSDFIIAYPGETTEDFKKTISLIKEIKFINSYSFVYNERPGTPASKQKKIDRKLAKERLDIFQNIADGIKKNYRINLINSSARVLFENKIKNENKYFGRDEYFNSVIVESNRDVTGKILEVKINQCNRNTLFGDVILNKDYKENAA